MAVSAISRHMSGRELSGQDSSSARFASVNRDQDSDDSSSGSSASMNVKGNPSHSEHNGYVAMNGHDIPAHKRKRSGTDEARLSPERQYDHSPPKRSEQPQHMADRALHVLGSGENGEAYHEGIQNRDSTNTRHSSPHAHNGHTDDSSTYDETSHWDTTNASVQQTGHDEFEQNITNTGQSISKRKRNFSNRTKTGCMTCRKRKKKCDETRPRCNNCQRGGFTCEGYGPLALFSKQSGTKTSISLQNPAFHSSSKDGQNDTIEMSQARPKNQSPTSTRSSMHLEGGPTRPLVLEDHEQGQHHFVASPQMSEPRSRPSYPGHQWPPQQPHQPQFSNAEHLPPLNELRPEISSSAPSSREMSHPSSHSTSTSQQPSTQAAHPSQYQSHPAHGQYHHQSHQQAPLPASRTGSQSHSSHNLHQTTSQSNQQGYWPVQSEQRSSYAPQPQRADSHHNPSPSHTRMNSASLDQRRSGAKMFTAEEVERSRMLRSTRYNHFDPTLINERQRCERALDRYNGACKLDSGMSEEEARGMLWKVFDPSRDTTHAFIAPLQEKGVLSHGVRVEAPFDCTYGYNIKLMENVYIGKNCTIDDAAKVEIGARTWIGPSVTILTTDTNKDMVDRRGSAGFWFAQAVIIASEVVIGQNAVIYPGVRLEKGATVEPFAVVRQSLGPNETQKAAVGERLSM